MADSVKRFRYYLRVRYGECDGQKVVFNARFADYVDLSTTEFLRALGFGEAMADGSFDVQLAKLTLEWKAPARFDQVLEISIDTTRLGNTSFVLGAEFRLAGHEQVLATAETVYVTVDAQTLKKTPLPQAFRDAIEKNAGGMFTDHAGYFASPAS